MEHRRRPLEQRADRVGLRHVRTVQGEPRVVHDSREVLLGAAGEIVDGDDLAAVDEQALDEVAADEPGAAGDHGLVCGRAQASLLRYADMAVSSFVAAVIPFAPPPGRRARVRIR